MKRKIAILVLTMLVVLSMTAVPAFAASKQVVELSNKSYTYNSEKDKWYQDSEETKTYKSGLLKQYEKEIYFRDEERPSKVTGTYALTHKYTYDSKKRITQEETIGRDWTAKNKYSYKGGHCKTQMLYYNGNKLKKATYIFKNDRLVKSTEYFWGDGEWKETFRTENTYKTKKTISVSYEDGVKYYRTVTTLNSKGDPIKETNYHYYKNNGKKVTDKSTKDYYYYKNGKLKKTVYIESDGFKNTFEYYKNGNLKKEIINYGPKEKATYNYNEDGKITSFNYDSEEYNNDITYHYNKKGLVTKEVLKHTCSDPSLNEDYKEVTEYIYKGYYKKIYPKQIIKKINGVYSTKEIKTYDYIALKEALTEVGPLAYGAGG